MERRVKGNFHAGCGTGEKAAIISKSYLSLFNFGLNWLPKLLLFLEGKLNGMERFRSSDKEF